MDVQSIIDQLKKPAEKILSEKKRSKEFIKRVQEKMGKVKFTKFSKVKKDLSTGIEMLKSYIKGQYKEVPWQSLILLVGSLIYFLNPLDFIPDFIPIKGFIDDFTVLGFVLGSIKADLDKYEIWKQEVDLKKADINTESAK